MQEFSPHTAFFMISSPNYNKAANDYSLNEKIGYIQKTDLKLLAPTINNALDEITRKHDVSCHWG